MTLEEAKNWMRKSPFHEKCGISAVEIGEGSCVLCAEMNEEDRNLWGIAHGGYLASLCDSASGLAVLTTHDEYFVTTSSVMHYLEPARGPHLRAEANILKDGHTIVVVDVHVFDDNRLVAEGSFEFFCADGKGNR